MKTNNIFEDLNAWVDECLSSNHCSALKHACNIKKNNVREVWDCIVDIDGDESSVVLIVFRDGPLDQVNTSLQAHDAAAKCALACTEFSAFDIPTPIMLGQAQRDQAAAFVCYRVDAVPWEPRVRLQAAKALSRLYRLDISRLSSQLATIVRRSDPRAERTTGGQAPESGMQTLVHGDYFSANILPLADGLCIIDWETLALGDPMWDLGFLIGADRDLTHDEVESVIMEYERGAPVDRECLMWHKHRWDDFWNKRIDRTV